eukprot:symbB.v1.2.019843.t3/scaffold1644.1/size164340/13
MQADQNQVLLGRVAPLPRPSKEPLADNQVLSPPPPVNHSNFPSVGSAEHETRLCKPCVFFWNSKGCRNGQGCLFCHVCRPGEKKRRKQERRFVASMGHTEIRDTRTRSPVQGDQVLSPPPPVNHSNFPSVGSAEHETRRCDPCAFFWNSKGVKEGQNSSSEGLRCCAAPGIHRVWLHLSMNSFLRGGCPLAFEIFLKGDNCMNLDVVSVVAKFQNILPISLKALTEAVWRAEGHELTDDTTILLALLGPMPGFTVPDCGKENAPSPIIGSDSGSGKELITKLTPTLPAAPKETSTFETEFLEALTAFLADTTGAACFGR